MKRALYSVLTKIISGGQTGADRAALDFAIARSIPHGGWCPKGRLAEDGSLDMRYALTETSTDIYAERTERNVRDSDGTVIFTVSPALTGGCKLTAECARQHRKPLLHLSLQDENPAARLSKFLSHHRIRVLNVAGSRASKEPEVYGFVGEVLGKALPGRCG
jgi:hypothetical protein